MKESIYQWLVYQSGFNTIIITGAGIYSVFLARNTWREQKLTELKIAQIQKTIAEHRRLITYLYENVIIADNPFDIFNERIELIPHIYESIGKSEYLEMPKEVHTMFNNLRKQKNKLKNIQSIDVIKECNSDIEDAISKFISIYEYKINILHNNLETLLSNKKSKNRYNKHT